MLSQTADYALRAALYLAEQPERTARVGELAEALTVPQNYLSKTLHQLRATGSGAGCGRHWPLCNGEVIPRSPQVETVIEFTHRLTSGFSLLLIILLFIWAWRVYPRGSAVRLGASLSMLFIITEALIGAGLVLFEWVAQNASVSRAIVMAVHLINTYLLLAALALTGWWASGGDRLRFRGQGWIVWGLAWAWVAMLILGVSGALTALGIRCFQSDRWRRGLRRIFLRPHIF